VNEPEFETTYTPVALPVRALLNNDVPLSVTDAFAATALRSKPAISDLIFIISWVVCWVVDFSLKCW
jgi:hypothetical protein